MVSSCHGSQTCLIPFISNIDPTACSVVGFINSLIVKLQVLESNSLIIALLALDISVGNMLIM